MSGFAAFRQIPDDPGTAGIPVIVVTASAMTQDRQTIMAAGFDGYQSKPLGVQEPGMADAAQFRKLVAYNRWANEKILSAIDGMTAEELARPVDAYVGSLAKNLQHVLAATRVWRARWKAEVPPSLQDPITGSWRDAYAATHAELRAFVESLTDADADRIVNYKDSKGNPFQMTLGQLITHVVNHGAHHRAETGMRLERIGRSPGDMDYVYYCLRR